MQQWLKWSGPVRGLRRRGGGIWHILSITEQVLGELMLQQGAQTGALSRLTLTTDLQ